MPVSFLSPAQCDNYAKYPTDLPSNIVDSLFFLDDHDMEWIACKRGDFSRLGYALQLTTVRFIGAFISNLNQIPRVVIERIAIQIRVKDPESCVSMYMKSEQRWRHAVESSRRGFRWPPHRCVAGLRRSPDELDRAVGGCNRGAADRRD